MIKVHPKPADAFAISWRRNAGSEMGSDNRRFQTGKCKFGSYGNAMRVIDMAFSWPSTTTITWRA
ncbi:MAG: hypothetical protein ACRD2R_00495 [Terriglobales bacterium]